MALLVGGSGPSCFLLKARWRAFIWPGSCDHRSPSFPQHLLRAHTIHARIRPMIQAMLLAATSLLLSMAVLERGPLVGAGALGHSVFVLWRWPGENASLTLPNPIAFARPLPRLFPPYSHPLCTTAHTTPSPSPIPPFYVRPAAAASLNVVPSPSKHHPSNRPKAHSSGPAASASVYGCARR